MELKDKLWIFAYLYNGEYVAEYLIDSPDDAFANLEYADVRNKEYQIWEYPSGKIYDIRADRELDMSSNQFAVPGTLSSSWTPELVDNSVDKHRVSEAYSMLTARQ